MIFVGLFGDMFETLLSEDSLQRIRSKRAWTINTSSLLVDDAAVKVISNDSPSLTLGTRAVGGRMQQTPAPPPHLDCQNGSIRWHPDT